MFRTKVVRHYAPVSLPLPTMPDDVRDAQHAPRISIVTATYNRSNVLRHAIRSVINQTFDSWELLVIGDACTDDTADVVASFADPRIRFVNLATNAGEQSVANNEGVRLSRGRCVAYLNHDDIWLPQHLAVLHAHLEHTGADLVYALMDLVQRDGTSRLGAASATGRYELTTNVPASSWLFRRTLYDDVGPWKSYRECYVPPSRDWLQRARAAGKVMVCTQRVSVIAIQSSVRPGSYAERQDFEHERIIRRMQAEPDFLERELTAIALSHALVDPRTGVSTALGLYASRAARNFARLVLDACGLNPRAVRLGFRLRRGAVIDSYRRTRGLPFNPRQQAPTQKKRTSNV